MSKWKSTIKPPPRSWKKLMEESQERGLQNGGIMDKADIYYKRKQLLLNIWSSHKLGRSIEKAYILLVGSSGVGKSSTINHLFGLKEDGSSVNVAKTSNSKS